MRGKVLRCRSARIASLVVLVALAACNHKPAATAQTREASPTKLVRIAGSVGVQMDPADVELAGITVVKASEGSLATAMRPTGEIQPTDSGTVQVTSRLPGKITEALVSVGNRVHRGEVLAWVDSVDLTQAEATYQTAVSHAQLARHQLDQQRKLAGFGSLSEQPVEDARKAAAAADAAVSSDEAQLQVDRLALKSTRQLVDMGEITRKPLEDAQNAYAQAQSTAIQAGVTLHSTKQNLDRAKILFDRGVFSKQQLEDAETAYSTAVAANDQANTAENLAKEELNRQQKIFHQNLNGASSLQGAQSKLQQDEHGYQNDLIAQSLAHRQYQRALVVRKSGIPISQALQQAEDAYEEASIAVQGAANTLKLYGVKPGQSVGELRNGRVVIPIMSPIDGIVAARNMVVGQNTDTSTALLRLVNLDKVYVDAQVYEKDILGVSTGDPVQVRVSAYPNRTFRGAVQWIAKEVSPDTRTVTVRTVLRNPGWQLTPGMFASILIGSKGSAKRVSVPVNAILQEGEQQVAFVEIAPGQFVRRVLKVGRISDGAVAVDNGIEPGEEVVVGGNVLIEKETEKLEGGKSES